MNHEARILHLEGAANFRDFGGLPVSDGRFVRCGRLFRSDVLYRLTRNDTLALHQLGIRMVIDLRSHGEISTYPQNPLRNAGIPHVSVPIESHVYSSTGNIAEDYVHLLRNAGNGFREIFRLLASDHFPLVINCFAGKDRTGLTSALIQGALGVPDDLIVADYTLSERHMWRHMHIHDTSDPASAVPDLLPDWLRATSATMEETLDAISEKWGSIRGYLLSLGIPSEELLHIGATLLETSSTSSQVLPGVVSRVEPT